MQFAIFTMVERRAHDRFAGRLPGLGAALLIGALAACDGGGSTGSGGTAGSGGNGGDTTTAGGAGGQGGTTTGTTGGSGGTAGSGGGTGGSGGGAEAICLPGSEALVLDLAGASATPVAGVPPADGYSPGFSILEGPVWIGGALLISQISTNGQPPASRILRIVPGSAAEIFLDDAGTNGLALDGAGQLLGAVHKDGSISRFDLASPGAPPVVVAGSYMGARFNSPNDLAVRGDGDIYFTDPDWQSPDPSPQAAERAYRAAPGGAVSVFGEYIENGTTMTVQKPNGVVLRRDEAAVFVGGTSGLFQLPVAADGSVGVGARVAAVNGGVDGMTKDCAGNLYVTNGQGIVVLDETGSMIGAIPVGAQVTNVAFGGDDRKTLYITSLGSDPKLYSLTLNVPGYPN